MTAPVQRVGGVILAAGRSTRMGRPKPLLLAGDRSFLAACVAALREGGCDPVVAVVGGGAGEQVAAEAKAAGAVVAWNREAESEQVDSLRIGLDAMGVAEPDSAGALVLPVDHPLVAPATVRALLDAAAGTRAVVRPVHGDRPGHPTFFPRPVWAALADPDLEAGARSVLESEDVPVLNVAVDDPGVVADIDTPEAYRRLVGEGS